MNTAGLTTFITGFYFLTIMVMPVFAIGLVNRTKAILAGRKGPRLNQSFFDFCRLLRKMPVYSETTSWIFQVSPWVGLATSLTAALICPVLPGAAPVHFSADFIYFAYLLGLGRVFMILGALDTGSSFEGMGASREVTYAAFAEPALFFVIGTLGMLSGHTSFHDLVLLGQAGFMSWPIKIFLFLTLFVLLQIETSRVPVDDPQTHLELTMIHEVMVLDHSGPELAAMQWNTAVKFVVISGLIAAFLNPVPASGNIYISAAVSLVIMGLVAVTAGLAESLVARLRLRAVPVYALIGVLAGLISLLAAAFSQGAVP